MGDGRVRRIMSKAAPSRSLAEGSDAATAAGAYRQAAAPQVVVSPAGEQETGKLERVADWISRDSAAQERLISRSRARKNSPGVVGFRNPEPSRNARDLAGIGRQYRAVRGTSRRLHDGSRP